MSQPLFRLQQRIIHELPDIERSVIRTQQAWQAFQQTQDHLYLDSVALNLHGFYNGLERLFETIAAIVPNQPIGIKPYWHKWRLKSQPFAQQSFPDSVTNNWIAIAAFAMSFVTSTAFNWTRSNCYH